MRPNPGGWAPELAVLRKGVLENHVLSVGVACRTGRSPKGLVRKTAPFRKEGRANRRILWRGWSRAGRETGGRRKAESRGAKEKMPEIKIQRPQPYLGPSGRLKSRSRAHPTEGGGWLIFRPPLEASREPSWSVLGQFCAVSGRPKRLRCFFLTFPAIQHRTISVQLTALLSFRGGVDAAGVPLSLTRVLNFAHYVPEAHCFRYVRTCVYVLGT